MWLDNADFQLGHNNLWVSSEVLPCKRCPGICPTPLPPHAPPPTPRRQVEPSLIPPAALNSLCPPGPQPTQLPPRQPHPGSLAFWKDLPGCSFPSASLKNSSPLSAVHPLGLTLSPATVHQGSQKDQVPPLSVVWGWL